jgi:ABC-2 type transport system permease protein
MSRIFSPFIRLGAFTHKEIVEIFRQPRLLFTLIIGPFLILLLFGIGYRNEGRSLRAIVVAGKQNPVYDTIRQYGNHIGNQLKVTEITDQLEEAKEKLQQDMVDVVIVIPDDAGQAVQNNHQSLITIYHNEVDPYQADYIEFMGKLYTENLNRSLLGMAVEKKKSEAGTVQNELGNSIQAVRAFRKELEAGQITTARESQAKLDQSLARVSNQLETILQSDSTLNPADAAEMRKRKDALQQKTLSMSQVQEGKQDYSNEEKTAEEMERDLLYLQANLARLQQIDSRTLIQPFVSQTRSAARSHPQLSQYFIPSIIVLLLQHLSITLAGLSVVREFRTGAAELFQVSPLRSLELLLGKYLGFLIVGAVAAFFLTVVLSMGLKLPMLGDWRYLGAVMITLLFCCLAIGFTFSLLAQTEAQAIQYTMIFLLLSIFFSGFLLNLQLLWPPIRVISWLLPATYGIRLAQQIMLRGQPPDLFLLALLFTLGAYFFVVSYRLLRRRFAIP